MENTWILIANAHRARVLERQGNQEQLTELKDFVYPQSRGLPPGGITGESGKGHGRTAHHGTQFEPHTAQNEKEQLEFARVLASYLNEGAAGQGCSALVLIATSPLLGALRPLLNHAANAMVRRSVPLDLTHYQNAELRERIDLTLALPEGQTH